MNHFNLKNFWQSCIGFLIFLSAFILTSCVERDDLAPVEEPTRARYVNLNATHYKVVKGDTLYSIAFRYDLDYRQMAEFNRLKSPYTLQIGQVLQLKSSGIFSSRPQLIARNTNPLKPTITSRNSLRTGTIAAAPNRVVTRVSSATPPISTHSLSSSSALNSSSNSSWAWPARGRVVENFSPLSGIKGINIEGKKGDKIYAAASGVVAYAGSGLAGYGNLIIIKHNDRFLTAYGNNLQNRVHEGQVIHKGQVIADMGIVNRKYWGVHFEIRQLGKPVNPLNGFLK